MHDESPEAAVEAAVHLPLAPAEAFRLLVEELSTALARTGLRLDPGPDGRVTEGGAEVGRVVVWEPGRRAVLSWHPAPWQPELATEVVLALEATADGTRAVLAQRGWGRAVAAGEARVDAEELAGWFASEVAAPLLRATAPRRLGDWLTDRRARRPFGPQAHVVYGEPLYHYPNFRVILSELALGPDDHLLEVGCGGGALLRHALESGCRAAAVDHSPEMVRLARETNRDAVADGRLDVREADAGRLPFADGTFTCATMTGVLGFLEDPVAALAEMRRVLTGGGRLVVLGSDPELRGTPGAPEPMASRLSFYEDEELAELGRAAGFQDVRAVRRDLEPFAREVGVPEEHLWLFSGPGARFLLARKRG